MSSSESESESFDDFDFELDEDGEATEPSGVKPAAAWGEVDKVEIALDKV
mgnify:CR=1 FL=1